MVRTAFTLIELIFAIVVIGITVISLPMMGQVINKGIEGNMVQEAIFIASTELNQAVTAKWDENSLQDGGSNSLARVIDNGNCDNNELSTTYRQKIGHINQPFHRRCLDLNTTTISNASSNNNIDALDDMEKTDVNLTNSGVGQAGYKQLYTTTVNVTNAGVIFGEDQANANSDIKKITVTVSDNDGIITSLITYSANIGEVDYYKRSY